MMPVLFALIIYHSLDANLFIKLVMVASAPAW
jgi:hypothetical protein